MKNIQVIQLLKKLSPRETKKLNEMVCSPYFNKNERCVALLELIQHDILKEGKAWDTETVFFKIFPEKKEVDNSLTVLMSKLLDLVQEVVLLEQLRLRPHTRNYWLLKGLTEKGEHKMIAQIGEASLKKIVSEKKITREDYQNNYLITKLLYEKDLALQQSSQHRPTEVIKALDTFYLSHRLPLTYEMMNVKQVVNTVDHNLLAEKVLEISHNSTVANEYLVRLYRLAVLLVKKPEEEQHFEQLLSDLEQYAAFIPKEELHTLYSTCLNFCVQQLHKGKQGFYERMFNIYEQMIAENVLFVTKNIPAARIKNVVVIACRLGKMEWAHAFLEQFGRYLEPADYNRYYLFYRATIFFYQKSYGAALEALNKMNGKDLSFDVGRRVFLMKIYYELQEDIALFSLMDSFYTFLRRRKKLANPKISYQNFAKMLKKIAKARQNPKPVTLEKLKEQLEILRPISDEQWLREKLEEL